jgi:SPP1 gp7 family putative phage head morphogenesis protein
LEREGVAISRMQRAYKAATKASIDELEALEGRIAEREANGEPPSETILWMRQRIIDNIEELGKNLKKFSIEGATITADGQLEAAILANEASVGMVEAAAGRKPAGVSLGSSWTNLPDEQLQAFVGMAGDGSPLGELFATIPQVTTDAMQMALVQGISLGEGPRTVARRVRRAADIGRYRAETIARTEMIRSAREAQRQLYTQNTAVTGYRRQATQDSRVCLACLALSGTLQATDTIMPSHPNCRCVMIPETLSWAEITGDSSIPDTRPEVATPESILAGLTREDKFAIMGRKRYEMYLNGMKLNEMVEVVPNRDWGPTTRVKPLRDFGIPTKPFVPKPKPPVTPKPKPIAPPAQPKPVVQVAQPKPVVKPQPVVQPKPIEPPKPIEQPKPIPVKPEPVVPKPVVEKPKPQPKPTEIKPEIVKPTQQVQVVEVVQPVSRTAEQLRDKLREIDGTSKRTIDDLRAQIKVLNDQYASLQVIPEATPGEFDLDAFLGIGAYAPKPESIGLSKQIDELTEQINKQKQLRVRSMHEALRSEKPIEIEYVSPNQSIYKTQVNRSNTRTHETASASETDHKAWIRDLETVSSWIDERPLKPVLPVSSGVKPNQLFIVEGKARKGVGGWFSREHNVIAISKATFSDDNVAVMGHEFIHYLDFNSSTLRQATTKFYNYRTRLDRIELHPQGYVKVDNWGRDYAGLVMSDLSFTGAEVPSVGIEFLLQDPLAFAERDFEYFKFMVDNVLCSSQQ